MLHVYITKDHDSYSSGETVEVTRGEAGRLIRRGVAALAVLDNVDEDTSSNLQKNTVSKSKKTSSRKSQKKSSKAKSDSV